MKSITTEKGEVLLVQVNNSFVPKLVKYPRSGLYLVDSASKELNAEKYKLPEGCDTILGEITKDGPQFDVTEFVHRINEMQYGDYSLLIESIPYYYPFSNPIDSFVSLLNSQGVYLENRSPHPVDINPNSRAHYDKLVGDWEQTEANTLKEGHKYIAILKIR